MQNNLRCALVGCAVGFLFYASEGLTAAAPPVPPLVLVENGAALAPIIVFEGAPPMTRRAADELADYIEKVGGVRPEVIEGRPDPLPGKAIWVGYQSQLDKLFPEIDFNFRHPEEILIAATTNHLVIAGRDVWHPDHQQREGRHGQVLEGIQREYGTVNAVYTFLQDYLGVRWLWPGTDGEDVPQQSVIALAPGAYRYHPRFRYRHEVFYFSSLYHGRTGPERDWTRFQRLQFDSLYMRAGGHAFSDWWERFHETHPEYFALQPDGTRSGFPAPRTAKLCESNPAVWRQWLADVGEQLARDPNLTVFGAAANDSWSSGHCVCADCRAWDHPDAEPRRFSWRGLSQDYVALSDRQVTFANQCARLLRERYPDRPYYVFIHAYGLSRPPPIKAVPDDNVIISYVCNSFGRPDMADRASPVGTLSRDQIKGWARVARNWIWRPNLGDQTGGWRGMPDIGLKQAMADYRFAADLGCLGVFSALQGHWATQGPLYYLIAQLAWNPYQDGRAVLDDYYRRGFGPAAGELAGYWGLMESTRDLLIAGGQEVYPSIYDAYDQAFFDRAHAYLDRAAAAAGDQPLYAARVRFVRAGLDYVRLIADAHVRMKQVRAGAGDASEAAARQVRENWAAIDEIHREYPHAIRATWVGPARPAMRGLHPDHNP